MPHVNIWVRKDDEDLWNAIEDKPTFLHDALSNRDYPKQESHRIKVEMKETNLGAQFDLCKAGHYTTRTDGKCSTKGCKYAC